MILNPWAMALSAGRWLLGNGASLLGKLADSSAQKDVARTTAKSAIAQKALEQDTELSRIRQQHFNVLFGWWPFRVCLAAILFVAVWHTGGVYLDSCAHLPVPWWDNGPTFMPHVPGSWRYEKLPGAYAGQEFQIIATITGLQITQSVFGLVMKWLDRR